MFNMFIKSQFLRTFSTIVIFNILALNTSLAATPEKNFAAQAWARNQSVLQTQRASRTYKRIYNICSQGLELSKLRYVYESANQVKEILSFNEEIFQKMKYRHSIISPALADDLNNPSFFVAMADCGFSEHERNLFVANLLVLDVSGKLLAISGTLKLGQIIGQALTLLRARSPIAFWGISAASVTQSAIQLWNKVYPERLDSSKNEKESKQMLELTNELNDFTHQGVLQNQKIKKMLLAMYDEEIIQDNESLKQYPDNSTVRSHLELLMQSRLELAAQLN